MLLARCSLSLVLICTTLLHSGSAKSPCDICKDIINNFKSGLEKTVKSNFGGGNTNWEEKSLGKWKTSETRLVEIVEHHICVGNDKECHMFFEHNEEALEDWYFNIYKDLDSADSLHEHLCIASAKACCPDGKYGKECTDCPTDKGHICGGHGTCKGDGTRSGDGTCSCNTGYKGTLCEECADNYYEQLTGSIGQCLPCHESCEDTCTGGEPLGCDDCKDGYTWSDSMGCQDDDECSTDEDPCTSQEKTYCSNTVGSYTCKACHFTCETCTGPEESQCSSCIPGYERTSKDGDTSTCQDIDECTLRPELCTAIKGAKCYNTPGSYDCKCELDNQTIEEDQCVDIILPPATEKLPPEDSSNNENSNNSEDDKTEEKPIEQPKKTIDKSKKGKRTKQTKSKPAVSTDSGQPKIDVDAMMNEAGGMPDGKKRKYRTLDSMVLVSATGLYLVMCLVFNAEFFKTSLVTMIYAIFVYIYAGQYV